MTITDRQLLWAGILTSATLVGSYGLGCIFPFAAVAALAALTLDARRGALLVAAAWLANQAVGYGLLDYPVDSYSIGRGLALGVGAMGAFAVAKAVAGRTGLASPRAILVLAAAFATQQAITFIDAVYSGSAQNYALPIVGQVAVNDALWFGGLALIKLALDRLQPATVRPTPLLG